MSDLRIGQIDGDFVAGSMVMIFLIGIVAVVATCTAVNTRLEKPKSRIVCKQKDQIIVDEPNVIEIISLNEKRLLGLGYMKSTYRIAGNSELTTVQGFCTVIVSDVK